MLKLKGSLASLAIIASIVITNPAAAQGPICDGVEATIVGSPDDDLIIGTAGDDVIFAAQGNDWINGAGGDDIICGGQGDDTVIGGLGFDILFGAQGDDLIFAADFGTSAASRDDIRGARMFGGLGNDIIHGSNRWDRMQGGPGFDELNGYEGRDWLRGGPDRDWVNGGPGIDDVHGGNGPDRITVTNGDSVRGGNGSDWCVIEGPAELFRSCGQNQFEPGIQPRTLEAGAYSVPGEAQFGYWRTTSYFELNDSENRIVTNSFVDDDGPTIAIVDPRGVSVEFRRSATRVEAAPPVNPIGQSGGRALVGYDISPGQYRVVPLTPGADVDIATVDGRGQTLDIASGQTTQVIEVPAEAVFLDWSGRLERVS